MIRAIWHWILRSTQDGDIFNSLAVLVHGCTTIWEETILYWVQTEPQEFNVYIVNCVCELAFWVIIWPCNFLALEVMHCHLRLWVHDIAWLRKQCLSLIFSAGCLVVVQGSHGLLIVSCPHEQWCVKFHGISTTSLKQLRVLLYNISQYCYLWQDPTQALFFCIHQFTLSIQCTLRLAYNFR